MSRFSVLSVRNMPRMAQWCLLVALSVAVIAGLEGLHVPAALLLGPMAAGIILALLNVRVRVARAPYLLAQSVVGCMIAHMIPTSVMGEMLKDGPIFFGGVISVIIAAAILGWVLARQRVLPGTSAVWGSSPGAATAMTLLAGDFGADVRIVAFMQYLRVIFVALAATAVAGIFSTHAPVSAINWFPPVDPAGLAGTAVLIAAGFFLTRIFRVPSGAMLIPMVLGILLHGILPLSLPPWLLVAGYAMIGWSIGLRFTREILGYVFHALPGILLSIFLLISFCGLFAAGLVCFAGVSPLTAYLATSPGGADTVAIIAASSRQVDVAFVMSMQAVRLLLVILTGPPMARFIAARLPDDQTTTR